MVSICEETKILSEKTNHLVSLSHDMAIKVTTLKKVINDLVICTEIELPKILERNRAFVEKFNEDNSKWS